MNSEFTKIRADPFATQFFGNGKVVPEPAKKSAIMSPSFEEAF
jgi:hypothetical protein